MIMQKWREVVMKTATLIFLVCFSLSATAETYKCIQSGKTTYSSSPCGDNAQVVGNHITVEPLYRPIIQEQGSARKQPVKVSPAVKTAVAPVQPVSAPVINCDPEEANFEAVKKAMREGYPASLSNYWHDRFVRARDAYDSCEERRQKGISGKY
jgi:hypothetical protein